MPANPAELVPPRWTSRRTLLGMPLYDIVNRPAPEATTQVARGFVAIGPHAVGVIAMGGVTARGVVAVGGVFACGGAAFSGCASVGLLALSGIASIAAIAVAGLFSLGVVVAGWITAGVTTLPQYVLLDEWWFVVAVGLPAAVAVFATRKANSAMRRDAD